MLGTVGTVLCATITAYMSWLRPPIRIFDVNFDASILTDKVAVNYVIRDHDAATIILSITRLDFVCFRSPIWVICLTLHSLPNTEWPLASTAVSPPIKNVLCVC